ncbi:hypothetical protein [Sulfurimonas sp.]|uniref:hypothetical protein n=1 Tax=Sulfurimonas sp. TaxID=2022749 RepID=UPI0028D4E425|nr:hypothetical protein [Sulfurimonas sp.]
MKWSRDERVIANIRVVAIEIMRFCFSCRSYFFCKYSPSFIPGNTENIIIGTAITKTNTISGSII